ncbi:hypothetical protein bsdtb5_13620 [Anaeromicropila herbilytica]|uniref:Uncharacterized protein n=1 Tax=Anaeromicropila herbilytica TaxID=2785025 RepID=A0A7R7IBY8_9FIRM|nr:hypothetical protein bsdtb5_13620 [Anaeromicropila herbilytica]
MERKTVPTADGSSCPIATATRIEIGTANKTVKKLDPKEANINAKIPYFGGSFAESHTGPNKNSFKPTFIMLGPPLTTINIAIIITDRKVTNEKKKTILLKMLLYRYTFCSFIF